MKQLTAFLFCGILLVACQKEKVENRLDFGKAGGVEAIEGIEIEAYRDIILYTENGSIHAEWSTMLYPHSYPFFYDVVKLGGTDGGWISAYYYVENKTLYVFTDENDSGKTRRATLSLKSDGNDIVYKIRQSR